MAPVGSRLPRPVAWIVQAAQRLVVAEPDITAIALVGSWARHAGRPDSDVDLVVLTTEPAALLENDDWYEEIDVGAQLIRSRDFGAIQERRLRLPDGLELEVGIGRPSWAATDPIDSGTRTVADDGLIPIFDPHGLLAGLLAASGRYRR